MLDLLKEHFIREHAKVVSAEVNRKLTWLKGQVEQCIFFGKQGVKCRLRPYSQSRKGYLLYGPGSQHDKKTYNLDTVTISEDGIVKLDLASPEVHRRFMLLLKKQRTAFR